MPAPERRRRLRLALVAAVAAVAAVTGWLTFQPSTSGATTAPAISGPTASGSRFVLSSDRDHWVLVNFFASWCGPCRVELPQLRSLDRRSPGGLRVVSVDYLDDSLPRAEALIRSVGGTWPLVDDPAAVIGYHVDQGLPESFLVDPEGRVAGRIFGGVRVPPCRPDHRPFRPAVTATTTIPGNSAGPGAHYPSVIRGRHVAVVGMALALPLAGCGSSGSVKAAAVVRGAEPSGSATSHGMEVSGAFVPLPASPSVAAAYLELHDLTGTPDTLVAISTSAATTSMAMSEGTDSMQPLGHVTIPAHGTVSFSPGHDHVMLQGLTRKLAVGQTVEVSLRFAHAGVVDVTIPVVPLDRILGDGAPPPAATKTAATPTTTATTTGMGGM